MPTPDPFTGALCRQPGSNPAWWDADADPALRAAAAAICEQCPAISACAAQAVELGDQASGTWAGVYRDFPDTATGTLDAFAAIFGDLYSTDRGMMVEQQMTFDFETTTTRVTVTTVRREVS